MAYYINILVLSFCNYQFQSYHKCIQSVDVPQISSNKIKLKKGMFIFHFNSISRSKYVIL